MEKLTKKIEFLYNTLGIPESPDITISYDNEQFEVDTINIFDDYGVVKLIVGYVDPSSLNFPKLPNEECFEAFYEGECKDLFDVFLKTVQTKYNNYLFEITYEKEPDRYTMDFVNMGVRPWTIKGIVIGYININVGGSCALSTQRIQNTLFIDIERMN